MFSINLQSLFGSRSISFGEFGQSSRCANHTEFNPGLTRRDDKYSVFIQEIENFNKIGLQGFCILLWRS